MMSFIISLIALVVGYFTYGKFVEKVFGIDENRETPAVRLADGVDYVEIDWKKAFLIQFLNIAGLGPIFGAIAGALWGPVAFLWIVFGCIFAGATHDFLSGMLSVRHDGATIAEIVGYYLGEKAKKVMVIGGGVAGLCAAFIAQEKGHQVTLYEASDKLGGNMRLAAYPPGKGDITNMIRSYIVRCQKAGVTIKMNQEVTLDLIREEKPDSVIVASGSRTLILPIEGIDNPAIIHGSDLLDGKRAAGKKVLVVGGGMVGCETAAFLGEQNHDVTVIEFRDTVGADVIHEHRVYLMKDFEDYKIKEITGAKVCKFYEDGVEYETADGQRHESRGYDSVILSMGFRNYNPFGEEIKAIVPDTYVIGDATRARRALDATKEAYEVASTL